MEVNGGHKGLWTEAISPGAAWPAWAKPLASNRRLPANQDLDGWCRATWDPRCPPAPPAPHIPPLSRREGSWIYCGILLLATRPQADIHRSEHRNLCPCSIVMEREVGVGKTGTADVVVSAATSARASMMRQLMGDVTAVKNKIFFVAANGLRRLERLWKTPSPPACFDTAVVLICTEAALRSACRGEKGFKRSSCQLLAYLPPRTDGEIKRRIRGAATSRRMCRSRAAPQRLSGVSGVSPQDRCQFSHPFFFFLLFFFFYCYRK